MKHDDLVTGRISSLAFGGAGILRLDNFVIFVPYTAVGDVVEAKITKVSKNFAQAVLCQLITPGPGRQQPPCPYFGTCGGCQLQHLTYSNQLDYKKNAIEDALKRIGGLKDVQIEVYGSNKIWEYRRHIRLKLFFKDGTYRLGFIGDDHQKLVEIDACTIFSINKEVIESCHRLISKFESVSDQEASLTLLKNEDSSKLMALFRFSKHLPTNFRALATRTLSASNLWSGISGIGRDKNIALGDSYITLKIEDLMIQCTPSAFLQNNADQSLAIYKDVTEVIVKEGVNSVLDLYCGIGITSLLLAKQGVEVVGIEENPEAILLANNNAKANNIDNVKFIQGDVCEFLLKQSLLKKADVLLVNPPRIGLDSLVIDAIKCALPKNIVYISCMPATLARDISKLRNLGYQLTSGKAYDMFPQTAHVETVLTLQHTY